MDLHNPGPVPGPENVVEDLILRIRFGIQISGLGGASR